MAQSKYARYGAEVNTHDWVKFLALVIMTVDHIGAYLYPEVVWLRAIGRVMTPAWFFLAGYSSASWRRSDIALCALLLTATALLTFQPLLPLNVLVSLIACRFVVDALQTRGLLAQPLWIFVACMVWLLPSLILLEYGTLGILFACMGAMVRAGSDTTRHRVFYALSYAAFVLVQIDSFGFNAAQGLFVALLSGACVLALYRYRLRPLFRAHVHAWWAAVIRFLSRYSLYYYLAHRAALQVAALLLYPEAHAHFRWMR